MVVNLERGTIIDLEDVRNMDKTSDMGGSFFHWSIVKTVEKESCLMSHTVGPVQTAQNQSGRHTLSWPVQAGHR